jgi:sigma-54 dependent transcriptional regulator, acetoin dehydrogenase operon transcriptional activator AcoR
VSHDTLTETGTPTPGAVCYLVYILGFDDLATPRTTIAWLAGARPFELGRDTSRTAPALTARSRLGVPDGWMSTRHAVVERRGERDLLRDLGSKNGTFVNGKRISEQRLTDGDLIQLGRSLFCYREVPEPRAAALAAPAAQRRIGPVTTFCA